MNSINQYHQYLKSESWRRIREALFKQRGIRCEKCGLKGGNKSAFDIHHLSYARIFEEELEDLIIVCRPCHNKIHNIKAPKPKNKKRKPNPFQGIDKKDIKLHLRYEKIKVKI